MTDPIDITDLHRQAAALRRGGRLMEAKRFYQTIQNHEPDHAVVPTNLGTLSLQKGLMGKGIEFLGRSLAINPAQAQALNIRGNVLSVLNRFEEALDSYDSAIALRPDYAEATHALFDSQLYVRNLEAAYLHMWKLRQANLAPEQFRIPKSDSRKGNDQS